MAEQAPKIFMVEEVPPGTEVAVLKTIVDGGGATIVSGDGPNGLHAYTMLRIPRADALFQQADTTPKKSPPPSA